VNQASVIGRGTVVRGNVRGSGSLEILGRVDGDVNVGGDVVLGEEGAVKGNVSGASVTVAGAVQGDVRASDAVLLERGARVVGDLTAPRIGVSTGALVRGLVRTDGEAPLTSARRPGGLGRAPQAFTPRAQPAPKADATDGVEAGEAADKAEDRGAREAPPPPVVPALAKGQKAKKKKKAD
jgi:cytoskeletal protein CcmA (bactofilin family)